MNFVRIFEPKPILSDEERTYGLRMLTLEGMSSIGFTTITTSGFLAAFALALGANNLQIGILAAIPFVIQPLQIPVILIVERLRRRKLIAISTWIIAQLLWFPMALIPVFMKVPGENAISMLLVLMTIRGLFSAITNCSWNSWVRDLVPQKILGRLFSRRLALSTLVAAVFGLGAAFFVDYWQGQVPENSVVFGYTYVLLIGAFFLGLSSPWLMSRIPEPLMSQVLGNQPSLWKTVTIPLQDHNFRRLMKFLFSWSFVLNMSVPFFAVYMLQRLELKLPVVIGLSVLSQFFTILFLRVWGPLADRFSSKAVLSICASLYLLVILGWTFTTLPERYFLTIPLLIILHIFAGIATAGVSLTIYMIGFKFAPQKQSASYLTGTSLSTNLGAGLGPLAGGLLAQIFSERTLALDLTWVDPNRILNLGVMHLTGIDFLFILSFFTGLLTLNTLAGIHEKGEAGREIVLGELQAQTRSALQSVSAVTGANFVNMFPASFLSRVPGFDVAIGVTVYQLADTAKMLTVAALRGGRTTIRVVKALQNEITHLWKFGIPPPQHETEFARQAARGALHAVDETPAEIERLARLAVVSIVRAMDNANIDPYDALWGAAYGVIEGANDTGADLGRAVTGVITGTKEITILLSLNEEKAMRQITTGIFQSAEKLGEQEVMKIKEVIPKNLSSGSLIPEKYREINVKINEEE